MRSSDVLYKAQVKAAGVAPVANHEDRRMAMAATILAGLLASKYSARFERSFDGHGDLERDDLAREALLLVYAIEDELDIFGK